jgi:ribonuclease HI
MSIRRVIDNSGSPRYNYHSKPSDDDNMAPEDTDNPSSALAPKRCAVCSSKAAPSLITCTNCKAIHYCSPFHQSAHRPTHQPACTAITTSQARLRHSQATLLAESADMFFPPEDIFNICAGRFWKMSITRPYMRARFAAAEALLALDTRPAVEQALAHFLAMLRLCRNDDLGARDVVPALLLRLGREQECYDFLKWWAVVDNSGRSYDFDDVRLPFLDDVRGADAFEAVDVFTRRGACMSLSQMVVLTLLKLRMRLDLADHQSRCRDDDEGCGRRQPGSVIRARIGEGFFNAALAVDVVDRQYRALCGVVDAANPHFWGALVGGETPDLPLVFGRRGGVKEAHIALHQCRAAWRETEGAGAVIDADTVGFTRVYDGLGAGTGMGDKEWQGRENLKGARMNLEKRRATGAAFPAEFKPTLPTDRIADCFPPAPMGRGQPAQRFINRCSHGKKHALVYTDGACSNNGKADPRGGWGVVYGPGNCVVSGRLENRGPFGGQDMVATSNRAELRAAIAALRLCDWRGDGFNSLVIATDSSYVVDGATGWAKAWFRKRWKTSSGDDVKNRDLWNLLLGEVERWKQVGLDVEFWKIPREYNGPADTAAKAAANRAAVVGFKDVGIPGKAAHVLALCLENDGGFERFHKGLISRIAEEAMLELTSNEEAALSALGKKPPPSVILVADAAVISRRKIREAVIDRLRDGATVVLAGCFSSTVTAGQFNRFCARLGLPWERGSFEQATALRGIVVHNELFWSLSPGHFQRRLFVKNVAHSAAWYTSGEDLSRAVAVFAKVGSGRLGYLGDTDGGPWSEAVVLGMCGLLG